jgi:tRNA(Met) C34 N-acetyltransferase TmcA
LPTFVFKDRNSSGSGGVLMDADLQNIYSNTPIQNTQNTDLPTLSSQYLGAQDSDVQQAYKDQLIAAGVHHHRAAEVAENLSQDELKVISEIWSQWGHTWQQLEQPAD